MAEEMIRVRVRATMKMHFNQTKMVPKKAYDEYLKLADEDARDSEFEKFAELYIETSNVCDYEDFEDLEMVAVDEAGAPLPDPVT